MIVIQNFDVTRLGVVMNRYAREYGFAAKDITQKQAGLLQSDLVKGMGPKSLAKAQRKAMSDVKKVFTTDYRIPNIKGSHRQGVEFVWLASGPKWITGVRKEHYKPTASTAVMSSDYKANRGGKLGSKFSKLGPRGAQTAQVLNRILVGRGNLSKFTKALREKFGKMKASWCYGWDTLNKGKSHPPKWIWKHVTSSKAHGGVMVNLTDKKPSVTLISRATGIQNSFAQRAIKSAINKRTHAMLADLKLYAKGIKQRAHS